MKTNLLSFALALLPILFNGCGTTGGTNKFVLSLTNSAPHTIVKVASSHMEPGAAQLQAVNVYKWGLFDSNDLSNIEKSLGDSLERSRPGRRAVGAAEIRVHVVVRKYHVTVSNNAGAALACIAWAATDSQNNILHTEEFYAARKVFLVSTAGMMKDSLHRSVVRRIAETALQVAARPGEKPAPIPVEHTYLTLDAAAADLPKTFVSMGHAGLMSATPLGLLLPNARESAYWEGARPVGAFNWLDHIASWALKESSKATITNY